MGNRNHPPSSKGQLVSPGLHHPCQWGQPLGLVLCLEEDENSRAVMGHGETGELKWLAMGAQRCQHAQGPMLKGHILRSAEPQGSFGEALPHGSRQSWWPGAPAPSAIPA